MQAVIPMKEWTMIPVAVLGKTFIAHRAIASIASEAALSSYGVVGLSAKNLAESISVVLTKDPNRGIDVSFVNNEVVLNVYIVIEYGTRIKSVAVSVAENIKYKVEKATGLIVSAVNIHVRGLRISNTD
jgi:uncharacterized alkaline shock family protein YloU